MSRGRMRTTRRGALASRTLMQVRTLMRALMQVRTLMRVSQCTQNQQSNNTGENSLHGRSRRAKQS
jgi:hypothetical protein